jgi:hypothetical protein
MTDKTLKHFFEVYKPKAPDEQKFVDKHVTIKHQDRNGNGDDVFKGNTKYIKRKEERKGYDVGEDEKVYEENELDEDVGAQIAELMRKKNAATSPIARKNIESQIAKLKRQKTKSMTAYNEEAEQIDETAKIVAHLQKRYGDNIRKSHVMSAAKDFGVDSSKLAKAVRTKLGKNMLGEKLDMDKASMGDVITDFKDSNAPQFKGKSQDKRRAMAIAAKLSAERGGKPLRKEEKLADLLGDLTETHRRTMLSVFDKLNEDNQKKFLEACETPDGVESMLDFSISHRGE